MTVDALTSNAGIGRFRRCRGPHDVPPMRHAIDILGDTATGYDSGLAHSVTENPMNLKTPIVFALFLVHLVGVSSAVAQQPDAGASVLEIRSILNSIHPYLPAHKVASEIDLFGSTSMDSMAHGWAAGFKKFHPKSKITISAEGSEAVFERVAQNPSSIVMVSRPVSEEDLQRLKEGGMKQPVAVMVAREALGVFVNQDNPIDSVDYRTLVGLACANDAKEKLTWGSAGLTGKYASEPIVSIGRDQKSGTRTFLREYVFRGFPVRATDKQVETNFEVVSEIAKDPFAVGISSLRCGRHGAKLLHLKSNGIVIPTDEHSILVGNYPLIQPLCLVLDMGQTGEAAIANREFVLYALSQAGQTDAILAGYFPFDPPTLRGQIERIGFEKNARETPLSSNRTVNSAIKEGKENFSR